MKVYPCHFGHRGTFQDAIRCENFYFFPHLNRNISYLDERIKSGHLIALSFSSSLLMDFSHLIIIFKVIVFHSLSVDFDSKISLIPSD